MVTKAALPVSGSPGHWIPEEGRKKELIGCFGDCGLHRLCVIALTGAVNLDQSGPLPIGIALPFWTSTPSEDAISVGVDPRGGEVPGHVGIVGVVGAGIQV